MATTTFNDLITFSRGSNATVTGPNGLIQWAPSNLLTNSESFEAAIWTKVGLTIPTNLILAPDGTLTADKLVPNTVSTQHVVEQQPAAQPPAGDVVVSAYFKAGELTKAVIRTNDDVNLRQALFNLSTGTVETGSGTVPAGQATIQNVGNGWYRCVLLSITRGATLKINLRLCPATTTATDPGASWAGNDVDGGFIWGAQLEIGSTATTYNNTSVRNLVGFSEAFDNAAWTKSNSSIVTGAQANPVNGLFNAQKLMEGTATTRKTVQGPSVATVGQTFSAYVKPAGRNFVAIGQTNGSGLWAVSLFNLSTGSYVAGYQAGGIAIPAVNQITPVGNGWFRVSCFLNVSGGAGPSQPVIMLGNGGDPIFEGYTGDGNSGIYIYGAMLSNSASLDPYVPTPGAAPSSTAYYGPRFDYDPVTLAARGLLVEEQRVNLLTYSEQFDNAAWTKVNATVTANAAAAPDGTTNADKLAETAAVATHFAAQSVTTLAAAYTFSCYVKAAERNFVMLYHVESTAAVSVNLTTGSANTSVPTTVAPTAFSVISAGNGWWRVTMTSTATAASNNYRVYSMADATTFSFAGVTGNGILLWGAQLEAGAFATSYIPTIASTATRSADVATISGSLFSQWYNQTEGSFLVEASSINNDTGIRRMPLALSDAALTFQQNKISPMYDVGSFNVFAMWVFGTASLILARPSPSVVEPAVGVTSKLAFTIKSSDTAAAINGNTPGTATTAYPASLPMQLLRMGGENILDNQGNFNGHIRSIRYVPVRAADFQLQQVTT